jgi:3'-phosphoadenosine 5'-phosphosulfate sulfotransferase
LSAYRALLYDWVERTLRLIQRRFDAYANGYRAQVERLIGHRAPAEQEGAIRRDLETLHEARLELPVNP